MDDSPESAAPSTTEPTDPESKDLPPAPRPGGDAARAAGSNRTTTILAVVAGVLLITTIAFGALWWSAKSERDDLQAEKAAAVAAQNARPDLKALATRYFSGTTVTYSGTSDSLDVTERSSSTSSDDALGKFLAELGFTNAVIDRMGHTRALDGTQTAQGRNVNVSWTYHPDDGLQMVFEVER